MKKTKSLKFTIYVFIFIITTATILSAKEGSFVMLGNLRGEEKIIATKIVYTIAIFDILSINFILIMILRIIKSIELKDQFRYSNVKRMKLIAACLWIMAITCVFANFIAKSIVIDIKVIFLFVIAVFTEILIYIFHEGYKLKESEEVLQKENSLII